MAIKNCFAKADLGIALKYDDMEIDETDNNRTRKKHD